MEILRAKTGNATLGRE